ncbi:hypothetical protein ABH922_001980 [Rhodococcus sp. 27YEA15]|uniref:hypothetical protein n=1 Tax=Rhodococcus sp. 27YEA15 TaxID=3156259 RepID=UPI003C7E74B0
MAPPGFWITDRRQKRRRRVSAAKFEMAYSVKPVDELAALYGVSDADGEHTKATFDVTTVEDLGTNSSS